MLNEPIPTPAFQSERARRWWAEQPDIHASGTDYKRWIQSVPSGIPKSDRIAAHESIIEFLAPHYPIARDLSALCILRRQPGPR